MSADQSGYRGIAPLVGSGSGVSQQEYAAWYEADAWYPSRESKLVLESDLTPAAWIEPLLFEDSFEVRMTVPQGFEAYARVFFPFVHPLAAGCAWSAVSGAAARWAGESRGVGG